MKWTRSFVRRWLAAALLVAMGWSAYGCSDSASINPEVELSSLSVAPGPLRPAFSGATTQYNVDLSNSVTSVTVTAHAAVAGDTVSIDGQETTSRSIAVGPAGGPPKIVSIVVSESTSKSRTYTVVLNRAPLAGDNNLSALTMTPGALSPAFASGQLSYAVDVTFDVTSVTVSASKSDPAAVISGDIPDSGQGTIPLDGPGTSKNVSIIVTAPNGSSRTYTIRITRLAPSNDANLSALTVSAGSLDPAFTAGTLNYTVNVAGAVDSITVTATKSDPNSVMAALGSVIAAAGTPAGQVRMPLPLGSSTKVTITVTAQDGVNRKDYTIIANRPFR